jgi:hypothetical protein
MKIRTSMQPSPDGLAPGLDRRRAAGAPGPAPRKSGYGDDLLRLLQEQDVTTQRLIEAVGAKVLR